MIAMSSIGLKIINKLLKKVLGHTIWVESLPGIVEIMISVIVDITQFFERITATVIVENGVGRGLIS